MNKQHRISSDQIKYLASVLLGKTTNVYYACQSMFGVEVDSWIFDVLEKDFSMRRCIECNLWLEIPSDVCDDCDIEMHAED